MRYVTEKDIDKYFKFKIYGTIYHGQILDIKDSKIYLFKTERGNEILLNVNGVVWGDYEKVFGEEIELAQEKIQEYKVQNL